MASPIAERGGYRSFDHVRTHDYSVVYRVISVIAGAVPTIIGLIALTRVAWDQGGIDAAPVSVAGMTFTPAMAIGLTVLGALAMIAGATRDRASKLVVGGILLCAAAVVFLAQPETQYVRTENAHGWLLGVVGGVLVIAALLMSWAGSTRRVVDTEPRF